MRIALGVEYVGTEFAGWQTQENGRTVQTCVETALSTVANHPVTVTCAGRTDSGVHALGQVIHMNVTAQRSMRSWVLGTNVNLPRDVSILWAQAIDEQFHARFSAVARHYCYLIINRPVRPAIAANRVTWVIKPLNVEQMQLGADYLVGTHDFSAYRAVTCQAKNPVRTISRLTVTRQNNLVILTVSANAFLHHMVRNIAGVLIAIGSGEQPPQWAQTVLETRNRTAGGVTAPAEGLYLYAVDYPQQYQFPKVLTSWNVGEIT